MDKLLFVTAAGIPEEHLINDLAKAIRDYKELQILGEPKEIQRAKAKIQFNCVLIMTKNQVGDDMEKAIKLADEFKRMSETRDLLDSSSN